MARPRARSRKRSRPSVASSGPNGRSASWGTALTTPAGAVPRISTHVAAAVATITDAPTAILRSNAVSKAEATALRTPDRSSTAGRLPKQRRAERGERGVRVVAAQAVRRQPGDDAAGRDPPDDHRRDDHAQRVAELADGGPGGCHRSVGVRWCGVDDGLCLPGQRGVHSVADEQRPGQDDPIRRALPTGSKATKPAAATRQLSTMTRRGELPALRRRPATNQAAAPTR